MKPILSIVVISLYLLFVSPGHASTIDGDTVKYQYLAPDISTPFPDAGSGNYVVGPGVAIPISPTSGTAIDSATFGDSGGVTTFTVKIQDTASGVYCITGLTGCGGTWTFNGFELAYVSGPDLFSSVTIDPSTTMVGLVASDLSFNSDQIFLNWAGLPRLDASGVGAVVQLDIGGAASAPEPSTLLLLGSGLVGLCASWGRKMLKHI